MRQKGDRDDTNSHEWESGLWALGSDCPCSNLGSLVYQLCHLALALSVPQFHICKIGIITGVNS